MGKVCFSKILRYTCLAAIAVAAAFIAAITFANPASADPNGGRGNDLPLKEWDTDNLSRWVSSSFGRAGARNYRIPYHNYKGYFDTTPAKPCVSHTAGGSGLVRSRYDGSCPSGSSLLTRWCSYPNGSVQVPLLPAGQNTYNSVQGRWLSGDNPWDACPPVLYNPPSLVTDARHPQLCVSSGWILSLSRNCATRATASKLKHVGCQSAVADAFFQTGGDTGAVNDFPVADYGSESEAGSVAATGSRSSGCVEFAEQQDRLQASVAATGHYLEADSEGKLILKANSGTDILDTRITSVRSTGVYGRWDQKGTDYTFAQGKRTGHTSFSWRLGAYIHPVSSSVDYQRRVDTRSVLRMGTGLSSSLVHPWNEATGLGAGQGNFACTWTGWIGCVERSTQNPYGGVVYFSLTLGDLGTSPQFKTAYSSHTSSTGAQHSGRPVHLSAAQDAGGSWCPAKWHPRGQDAAYAIGNSTGRTLSSINSETRLKLADAHWCRSDVRYTLEFTAQQHNTCGTNGRTACLGPPGVALPAVGSEFESYGRKNCYKTMTDYDETSAECLYVFPLPECDPDPDNNSRADWREFTPAEVDNIGVAGEPLLVEEGAYCGTNINPPDLAGFDADPCVAVDVAVFENRPAGSNAEPGVDADDRTAAVSSSVAVFDLDISVPFPETASPPNQDDPDLGPIDPSGCADGEEERTNHGTRASPSDSTLPAASDQRKSTPASADPASPNTAPYPLPSSSSASNTAAPPSDYDADNSYAGVRANIAHRYASEIAENTCAAKKEEAELVLAVMKARDASFLRWLDDYKTAADSNKLKFIDCVFGIEDVAFVDNIASPYALLSDENGVVPRDKGLVLKKNVQLVYCWKISAALFMIDLAAGRISSAASKASLASTPMLCSRGQG